MQQYIHAFVPGGTFFITVTLLERGIYNLEWAADDNVRSLEME